MDYLLFIDEAPLPGPVHGTSGFAEKFAAKGPFDRRGRSLRQLDLRTRLLRYPCSYMIYSQAFDSLPRASSQRHLPTDVGGPLRHGEGKPLRPSFP